MILEKKIKEGKNSVFGRIRKSIAGRIAAYGLAFGLAFGSLSNVLAQEIKKVQDHTAILDLRTVKNVPKKIATPLKNAYSHKKGNNYNKAKEFDDLETKTYNELLQDLDTIYREVSENSGEEVVSHLRTWYEALRETRDC